MTTESNRYWAVLHAEVVTASVMTVEMDVWAELHADPVNVPAMVIECLTADLRVVTKVNSQCRLHNNRYGRRQCSVLLLITVGMYIC